MIHAKLGLLPVEGATTHWGKWSNNHLWLHEYAFFQKSAGRFEGSPISYIIFRRPTSNLSWKRHNLTQTPSWADGLASRGETGTQEQPFASQNTDGCIHAVLNRHTLRRAKESTLQGGHCPYSQKEAKLFKIKANRKVLGVIWLSLTGICRS